MAGVMIDVVNGTVRDGFGDTDQVSGIERYRGTASADSMLGDNGDNELIGLTGNDAFSGGRGSDWMFYNRDEDYADAAGAFGRAGVTVNLATGNATDGYGDADQLIGIENVRTTAFADTVTGSKVDNRLELDSGDDTADGGKGNDSINGSHGDDVLSGGSGNDVLWGNRGRDTVSGGAGADVFFFSTVTNVSDRITDFSGAEDRLSFGSEGGFFLKPVGHNLTLGVDFFLSTTSGGATSSMASFIYETDAGRLWFDYDGNGAVAPILLATLAGAPAVTAADFEFVDPSIYFG
jgi:Ca2+-binding RTX toxin-like protein